MANDIADGFIDEFTGIVYTALQKKGSMALNFVRKRMNVKGKTAKFQNYGKGTATQKDRNGDLVPMNPSHNQVTITLEDWHAPQYVDDLDLLKTDVDEKMQAAEAGAMALGRKIDSIIYAAILAGKSSDVGTTGDAFTKAKALSIRQKFSSARVPAEGRVCALSTLDWNAALQIDEFSRSDYQGELPYNTGKVTKNWLGIYWYEEPDFDGLGYGLAWYQGAVGAAIGQMITGRSDFVPQKDSTLINHKMSIGSKVIDAVSTTVPVFKVLNNE